MKTTARTKKFTTHKETSELAPWRSKTDYAAKLETIRRKEVRNLKKSFDRDRRSQ